MTRPFTAGRQPLRAAPSIRLAVLAVVVLLAACQPAEGFDARIDCPLVAPAIPMAGTASQPPASGAEAAPSVTPVPTPYNAVELLAGVAGATVETSLGNFTLELYPDAAPVATANFVALARCGFYEGVTFHRVLTGFVIQAGDPNTRQNQGDFEGLGTGGPGYGFAIETPPAGLDYDRYTVAMANANRPDSNGSQFFIALTDLDTQLPRTYTIFGRVTDGFEVVDAIGAVAVNDPLLGVPTDPVVINRIDIEGAQSTAR